MNLENIPDSSGKRAISDNERAAADLERQIEDLRKRAAAGENVDKEMNDLRIQAKRLKDDRSRIAEGGM